MPEKSLVPPKKNALMRPDKSAGLQTAERSVEFGKQLSPYTELKEGKKSGNLFALAPSDQKRA